MDIKSQLVAAVRELCGPDNFIDGNHRIKAPRVIDLINELIGEDMVMVPMEPTEAMKRNACLVAPYGGDGYRKANGRYVREIYEVMLATNQGDKE